MMKKNQTDWRPIDEATPMDIWLRTKLEGEDGENICRLHRDWCGDIEWVERATGITTVTHHSFAAPTHWKPLDNDPDTE